MISQKNYLVAHKSKLWHADRLPDYLSDPWKRPHLTALRDMNNPVSMMLHGWINYAFAHLRQWDTEIGEDYVLGPIWARIGCEIHGLLNGEIGNLDAGAISAIIVHNLTVQGFNSETGEYLAVAGQVEL